jgi:hypothetical protein
MKNLKVLVSIISLFLITTTVKAQTVNAVKKEDDFSVKFTGVQDNYLCFQVEIKSTDNKSILKISDKSEGELYSQNWRVKSPFQIFKIEKKDGQQIIFNLQTGNKEIVKTFSATTRIIENTTVEENGLVIL